jgi:hypothetical protein
MIEKRKEEEGRVRSSREKMCERYYKKRGE